MLKQSLNQDRIILNLQTTGNYTEEKLIAEISYNLSLPTNATVIPDLTIQPVPNISNIQAEFINESSNYYKIVFNKSLSLNNISYKYPNTIVEVLSKTSLTLRKGDKIGLIGGSGSGKTTLSNLIMGVISPSSGSLSVDNININPSNVNQWYNNISSVQQDVFIADNTIINNIAFGVNKDDIDTERVNDCIYKSGLKALIDRMELGVYSVVGESGRLLSGGERQRIGIARALYNKPSILILDEATGSLDPNTEKKVFDRLIDYAHKRNAVIIHSSHRPYPISVSDVVFDLNDLNENIPRL